MASDSLNVSGTPNMVETIRPQVQLVLEQNKIQNRILQAMRDGFKTVPKISEVTSLPTYAVLWHITSMKKYGKLIESGQDGSYPTYQLAEE